MNIVINNALMLIDKSTCIESSFKTCVLLVDRYKHEIEINKQDMLLLYSYFKQSTTGNAPDDCPSILDFKNYAKWSSWHKLQGYSKKNSMQNYVNVVKRLLNSANSS